MWEHLQSEEFFKDAIATLSGAIQNKTPIYDDMGPLTDPKWENQKVWMEWLNATFHDLYETLKPEMLEGFNLVFTWNGSNPHLKPTLLTAHQDVVPVPNNTLDQWKWGPWSGHYDNHYVWGRGATDTKDTLIGVLQAVDQLMKANFTPSRTLILAFGFDEEIGGPQGAARIATHLQQHHCNGVAVIVDEGSTVFNINGTQLAMPSVSEKGSMDVLVEIGVPGGHSSMPPPHTGIGIMSKFITMVEAEDFNKVHVDTKNNPVTQFLDCASQHVPNLSQDYRDVIDGGNYTEAVLRIQVDQPIIKFMATTTCAVDVISGGLKVNALPETVTLGINTRINIGETTTEVKERFDAVAKQIATSNNMSLTGFGVNHTGSLKSFIKLSATNVWEPSPLTPTDSEGATAFSIFAGTTRAQYNEDEVKVAPGITAGNTDTRHYWNLTQNIIRFSPGWDPEDEGLGNMHTVNERVGARHHVRGIQWYSMFIRNMDEAELP